MDRRSGGMRGQGKVRWTGGQVVWVVRGKVRWTGQVVWEVRGKGWIDRRSGGMGGQGKG